MFILSDLVLILSKNNLKSCGRGYSLVANTSKYGIYWFQNGLGVQDSAADRGTNLEASEPAFANQSVISR